jgi:hypothetical protein
MVQLHSEDDYVVVVKVEAIDPVTATTYSIFKEFKTRVEARMTMRKHS